MAQDLLAQTSDYY